MKKSFKEAIGTCAVDSGQLLIVDPCYLSRWKDNELNDPFTESDLSYSHACDITLNHINRAGTLGNSSAVVFAPGFGDGVYPVIAHYKDYGTKELPDLRIKKVEILLIN